MPRSQKSLIRKVSAKNQVAIPVLLMKKFDITPDGTVEFIATKDGILLKSAEDPIRAMRGMFKGMSQKTSIELKQKLRAEEQKHERAKFHRPS